MPVQLISVCLGARKALDVGVANRLLPAICCSVNRTAICPDGPGCWSPPQSPASGLRHPLISTLGKPATPPPARSPPPCSKPLPQLRLVSVASSPLRLVMPMLCPPRGSFKDIALRSPTRAFIRQTSASTSCVAGTVLNGSAAVMKTSWKP